MALSDLRGPSLIDSFTRLLGTFLRKYKNGGYSIQDCENKARALKSGRRAKAFLNIFEPLYQEYQKRLGERIDFEDMILRAAHYAEIGRYDSPFHHILVDEFQDISQSRARLIKALSSTLSYFPTPPPTGFCGSLSSPVSLLNKSGELFGCRFWL
ncbi:UvrD-helicase domain-containing protein, partial [Thiolapillus sp.]|uniref:UvrD-helicase domain-containing protein n=1 Tax=Thiolapillus sp. TaxID=2017437 RepID=UPI003AF7C0A8